MIASGIALALNRKAAAGNEHDEAVGEPYMQALKISTTGHTVSKSEVAAIIDLPSHMDHWFSESSPRSQPVLITCIVPKHVMKDPTASIPSPVRSHPLPSAHFNIVQKVFCDSLRAVVLVPGQNAAWCKCGGIGIRVACVTGSRRFPVCVDILRTAILTRNACFL